VVKKFLYAVSFVFALVAIAHLLRFVNGTEMTVGTWEVPIYISVVGFVIPSVLSALGFYYAKRNH